MPLLGTIPLRFIPPPAERNPAPQHTRG